MDEVSFLAAVYALQCVSESARALPNEIIEGALRLPWRAIEDSGNVFRHGYHAIDPERVRWTISNSLPDLLAFARTELARVGSDPDSHR